MYKRPYWVHAMLLLTDKAPVISFYILEAVWLICAICLSKQQVSKALFISGRPAAVSIPEISVQTVIYFFLKEKRNKSPPGLYLFIYLFQLRLGMPCEESCSDLLFEEAQKEMMTSTTQPPGPHSLHAYCHHQCCINGDHRQRLSLWGVI